MEFFAFANREADAEEHTQQEEAVLEILFQQGLDIRPFVRRFFRNLGHQGHRLERLVVLPLHIQGRQRGEDPLQVLLGYLHSQVPTIRYSSTLARLTVPCVPKW